MTARLEGGPFCGATARRFQFEDCPDHIGVMSCGHTCGDRKCHTGLHMRRLDGRAFGPPYVIYRLAERGEGSLLYRFADLALDGGLTVVEAVAA